MSAEAPAERAVARVDAAAVERNCALLASKLDGAELCAVVKADGYGHGAAACAAAALRGGASWLAVATAIEAEELRLHFPDARILTMGALTEAELRRALEADSDIGAWHLRLLEAASDLAAELGRPARVHVKHDSGMGRLGERDPDSVVELARRCRDDERLELSGLWTHFATADDEDPAYLDRQLARFRPVVERVRELAPGCIVHAANSAATLRQPGSHFDLVRCGVAIYGLDPFQRDPAEHGLEPALELRSWVAAVKRFPAGTSAGYGRRWSAAEDTWVGVLPVGYGDGVRRALSDDAEVLIGGRRYPLAGTVSMDNLTVDLGPETEVRPGAEAVLIGTDGQEAILAEDLAARLGTINYEITTGISSRVPRRNRS